MNEKDIVFFCRILLVVLLLVPCVVSIISWIRWKVRSSNDRNPSLENNGRPESDSATASFLPAPQLQPATPVRQKTLIGYVLFAWFFGGLGFHNFYAMRTKCARTQLLMALLSFGILMPVCWLWAIIECCVVDRDGRGVPFG